MRHSQIFALCIAAGAAIIAFLADQNTILALFMGAALGGSVAVMIVAFPLDLSYREPLRGKRTVHVVMTPPDQRKR
ncbi:MAG TPA: hypothetical protein VMD53_05710 [Rhizomicrobium sp.]|nr:hypothetical protein [Rhizomicrobium sp.]